MNGVTKWHVSSCIVFPFLRWLDEGEDDNLIERELELTEVRTVERKFFCI